MTTKIDKVFLKILTDLKESLPNIVLVGGWVPYCYFHYIWKSKEPSVQLTTDIDFGIKPAIEKPIQITKLIENNKHYSEKHLKLGKLQPYILIYRDPSLKNPIPIEFLGSKHHDKEILKKITGNGILINQLDYFDHLLQNTQHLKINNLKISVPTEDAYCFHKGLTFSLRENPNKKIKDILSLYFVLSFSPNRQKIIKQIRSLKDNTYWKPFALNIKNYFKTKNSQGIELLNTGLNSTDWPVLNNQSYSEMFMELLN